jgi:alkylation response protein AidB-like acyl-CoA dehydrogenase
MDFGLAPLTDAGRRFVALAEEHSSEIAKTAADNDRNARFPHAAFEAMQKSGFLGACVPADLGGLGVESVPDLVAGLNRIGRGDGSTALAVNMHVSQVWLLAWHWRCLRESGLPHVQFLGGYLRQIGERGLLMASAVAEAGTDILHPRATAVPQEGGTWLLNGHKLFGTLSPAAHVFQTTCRVEGPEGPRFAVASVPRNVPGVAVQDNWDAVGMRASGSHDIVFQNCRLPSFAVAVLGPWGEWSEAYLSGNIVITLGLVAVFLGVAEAARELALASVKTQKRGTAGRPPSERPAVRHGIAQIEVELAAARAMVSRTAGVVGDYFASHRSGSCAMDDLHELMKDFQCTKAFVTQKAVEIVDRAMSVVGGSAYLTRNPLSRLIRDVRAGSFMQPFSPNEASEYIGRVALGLEPTVWD